MTYEDEHEKVEKEELKIRGGEHIKVSVKREGVRVICKCAWCRIV